MDSILNDVLSPLVSHQTGYTAQYCKVDLFKDTIILMVMCHKPQDILGFIQDDCAVISPPQAPCQHRTTHQIAASISEGSGTQCKYPILSTSQFNLMIRFQMPKISDSSPLKVSLGLCLRTHLLRAHLHAHLPKCCVVAEIQNYSFFMAISCTT